MDAILSCPCCGQKTASKRPLVDMVSNTVSWTGGSVDVISQEAEVIEVLSRAFGRAVAYEQILEGMYGGTAGPGDPLKVLQVRICGVRKKVRTIGLEIETSWGRGYSLIEKRQEAAHAAA